MDRWWGSMAVLASLSTGCAGQAAPRPADAYAAGRSTMQLKSTAFTAGGTIPSRYTCDGENVSPPLAWSGVPERSRALALIVDDPDAPAKVWVHWVLYDLPASAPGLEEHQPAGPSLPVGAKQGTNDFERTGYGGPCPPGGTHRYDFHLYALDAPLELPPGATKAQVLKAMAGHVLADARLEATYQRTRPSR